MKVPADCKLEYCWLEFVPSHAPDQRSGIHWCWLYSSYMLGYLAIYGAPCSTCFTSSHQMTPLHWAPGIDHVDTVTCLVDKGANTSTKDEVSKWEYTANCKLLLLIRVCSQSPDQKVTVVLNVVICIPLEILSLHGSRAGQKYHCMLISSIVLS